MDTDKLQAAISSLLAAIGASSSDDIENTPARVAQFWQDHLISQAPIKLTDVIERHDAPNTSPSIRAPISLRQIQTHLICPHHLTLADARVSLAYSPKAKMAGFGALTRLARAATTRLTLQETATEQLLGAMIEALDPMAAAVQIVARHPCQWIPQPESGAGDVITQAHYGSDESVQRLFNLLQL